MFPAIFIYSSSLSDFSVDFISFDANADVKYKEVDIEVIRGFGWCGLNQELIHLRSWEQPCSKDALLKVCLSATLWGSWALDKNDFGRCSKVNLASLRHACLSYSRQLALSFMFILNCLMTRRFSYE